MNRKANDRRRGPYKLYPTADVAALYAEAAA
jgi:hypothetical protein